MDSRSDADARAEGDATDETGAPRDQEPGQSSTDVITMCLFGAMVLIASACFVIW